MELLRGEALEARLRSGALPMPQLLTLSIQIGGALEAAHERGILHRDITPANIFITTDGQAKILDFGLGKLVNERAAADASSSSPTHSRSSGVPPDEQVPIDSVSRYGSPEQVRGEPVDGRTDLYSFGLVMFEMATGQPAFPDSDPAVIFEAVQNRLPPSPRMLNPEVPAALDAIIEKAVEKDRALRYQHAADLVTDLRRVKRGIDSSRSDSVPFTRPYPQGALGRGPGDSAPPRKRGPGVGRCFSFSRRPPSSCRCPAGFQVALRAPRRAAHRARFDPARGDREQDGGSRVRRHAAAGAGGAAEPVSISRHRAPGARPRDAAAHGTPAGCVPDS